jgi:iron complex transport system ATP-binding protein
LDGRVPQPTADTTTDDLAISVAGAGVVRGGNHLLRDITWRVEADERWVILGPNGAGKTTLLNLAAGRMHPTTGTVDVLGERLGRTDVNELRTRIGLSTAGLADRLPGDERAVDVVLTAAWSVLGRFREPARSRCWTSSGWPRSPTAASARCPRASASGC